MELTQDLAIIGVNHATKLYGNIKDYVVDNFPYVQAKIDEYIPGLVDSVAEYSIKSWDYTKELTTDCYAYVSEMLKEKVFM